MSREVVNSNVVGLLMELSAMPSYAVPNPPRWRAARHHPSYGGEPSLRSRQRKWRSERQWRAARHEDPLLGGEKRSPAVKRSAYCRAQRGVGWCLVEPIGYSSNIFIPLFPVSYLCSIMPSA